MLAPYLFGLVVLVAVPAVVTFGLALTEYDLIRSPQFIGLENFRELIDDESTGSRSATPSSTSRSRCRCGCSGALGLALLLHRRFRGVGAYRTSAYLPTIVPDVAYALLLALALQPALRPAEHLSSAGSAPNPGVADRPERAQAAVIIMSLFIIGEGFIVAWRPAGASRPSCTSSREVENAKPLYMFWRLTLPVMAPTLLLLTVPRHDLQLPGQLRPGADRHRGRPASVRDDLPAALHLPEGFEYLRYGYAAAATRDHVRRHAGDRLHPVPHHPPLAPRVRRLMQTVDREQLCEQIERGDAVVLVDALPPISFAASHLPGAINIPPASVDERAPRRIPDQESEIVVYCTSPTCEASVAVGRRLQELGYRNVRHYPGGKDEWKAAGLPLEGGRA